MRHIHKTLVIQTLLAAELRLACTMSYSIFTPVQSVMCWLHTPTASGKSVPTDKGVRSNLLYINMCHAAMSGMYMGVVLNTERTNNTVW